MRTPGRRRMAWRRRSRRRRRRHGRSASGSSAPPTTSRRWVRQPHVVPPPCPSLCSLKCSVALASSSASKVESFFHLKLAALLVRTVDRGHVVYWYGNWYMLRYWIASTHTNTPTACVGRASMNLRISYRFHQTKAQGGVPASRRACT